jgi:hypothetical protein
MVSEVPASKPEHVTLIERWGRDRIRAEEDK